MTTVVATYTPPPSCKVYTPARLAAAMIEAVGNRDSDDWLEPSFGRGAFLSELSNAGVRKESITAIDLEPQESPADSFGTVFRGVDFLDWCRSTTKRFSRIVANPPYVSLLDLPEHARTVARSLTLPAGMARLPARSNLWAAFLMGAVRMLKDGGAITFVLPAAWDYADYARDLREELPKLFGEWVCLRCEEPLFPDVQEGSIVLVGRGFRETHTEARRISCLRLDDLITQLRLLAQPRPVAQPISRKKAQVIASEGCKLSDLVDIRLGGVTGDARYFLFNESRRRELNLPASAVKPVLSKANHLRAAFIGKRTWRNLLRKDARVWLFRPTKQSLAHPSVQKYLSLSVTKGGCEKSAGKIIKRELWHRVPLPRGVDGFMSGMSSVGPWMALGNWNELTATNTLYTVHFRRRTSAKQRAVVALSLLTSAVRSQFPALCRRYAAGLAKFEPGDLQALHIPRFKVHGSPEVAYRKAIRALLSGNVKQAERTADECLQPNGVDQLPSSVSAGLMRRLRGLPLRYGFRDVKSFCRAVNAAAEDKMIKPAR